MRLATLSLAGGLALLVPGIAAAANCEASTEAQIRACVASVEAGETVRIANGRYALRSPLVVSKAMRIRAKDPGLVTLSYAGPIDTFPIITSKLRYFDDKALLIDVVSPAEPVTLEGLVFEPPASGELVVGRALRVTGGEVVVEDCRLSPYDLDLDGSTDALSVDPSRDILDDTGGVFALVADGGGLELQDSTINGLETPFLFGSAIAAFGEGTVVKLLGDTKIVDNDSRHGAVAVASGATLEVLTDTDGIGPTLRDNTASIGGVLLAADGGHIDVYGGTFSVNRATRALSALDSFGGHIAAVDGSSVVVHGGLFEGGDASMGGSIGALDSEVTVYGGAFVSASARLGGHIGLLDLQPDVLPSSFFMSGGEVSGGVAALSQAEILVNDEQPDGNVVYIPYGGGVYMYGGDVSVQGGVLQDNEVEEPLGAGGAIFAGDGTVDIDGPARFLRNTGSRGGAVYSVYATVEVDSGEFTDNGAPDALAGGALQADWSKVTVDKTTFSGNRARSGGAITCFGEQTCAISASTFQENHGTWGGALYLHNTWTDLDDNTFSGNTAVDLGGHIFANSGAIDETTTIEGAMEITGGRFELGKAGYGGAVESSGVAAVVSGVVFSGNQSTGFDGGPGYGGAWVQKDAVAEFIQVTFASNQASYGGALYTLDGEFTTIRGSLFEANSGDAGGAVYLQGSGGADLFRNVFQGNDAASGATLMVLGPDAWASDGEIIMASNLVDGQGNSTAGAVGVANKTAWIHHNDLVRYDGPMVVFANSNVEFRHNLLGYSSSPLLAVFADSASVSHAFNAWWRTVVATSPIEAQDGREIELGAGAVIDNPRLRGAPDGQLPSGPLTLDMMHPRPWSPLLIDGYPAVASDAHIGIYGGDFQFLNDWTTDADSDGVPRIFDCDDRDAGIGEWLVQWIDKDGDGVGLEPWYGDECVLVKGNALVDGDCDDEDATVWDLCGGDPVGVAFYGSSCASISSVPGGGALATGLLGLLLLRRRRRRETPHDG